MVRYLLQFQAKGHPVKEPQEDPSEDLSDVESGIDAGNGKKLGVCGRRVVDKGGEMPYITAFVYDSGDQLLLPQKQRSQQWLHSAGVFGLRQVYVKQSLVTKKNELIEDDLFGAITHLGGHFYRITN